MKISYLFIIGWFIATVGFSYAQTGGYVSHYEWWGRLAVSKTFAHSFRWDAECHHRRQNLRAGDHNLFAGTLTNAFRIMVGYQPVKNFQIDVSPFAYFATQALAGRQNFTTGFGSEYRWAVLSEVTSPINRINVRYRIGYESRYMKSAQEKAYHLSGRFRIRYMVQWQVKPGKPLNLYAYDEVFINHDRPRTFDHNRIGGGFSYTGIKKTRIDISYNWMLREQNHYYDSEHVLLMMFYYLL
jgi:hypothetical protein